jgi:hypothetical protein
MKIQYNLGKPTSILKPGRRGSISAKLSREEPSSCANVLKHGCLAREACSRYLENRKEEEAEGL